MMFLVVFFLLQQGLAFHTFTPQVKVSLTSYKHKSLKIKIIKSNTQLNSAIPIRIPINFGSRILTSTFAVRKQLSFATNAWKAAIFVFVTVCNRYRKQIRTAYSSMEGGWKKRGNNGAIWRTVEIWRFMIAFVFKYVSSEYNVTTLVLSIYLYLYFIYLYGFLTDISILLLVSYRKIKER
jgi:hypothetical protein